MKNGSITVREFEPIKKDIARGGIGDAYFDELKKFVTEYNAYAEKHGGFSDSSDVFRIGFDRANGEYIKAKNYVGIIRLKSGFRVQILPKLDLSESEEASFTQTKKVFLKMLRGAGLISSKVSGTAELETAEDDIYEVFIAMYVSEAERLARQGLKSDYSVTDENAMFLKGKLLPLRQLKSNFAHKERFYISYDVFSINRPENRLIKAALEKLLRISASDKNRRDIKRLLCFFEAVEASRNVNKDFASLKNDRGMAAYENVLAWTRVFLGNKSFTSFEGETGALALLFPMEKLFEAYVAKKIKTALAKRGYVASTQESKYRLLSEVSPFAPERKIFSLRPDIVVRKIGGKSSETVIMDTKWKRLVPDRSKNYGISQADMYQMYAYCKEYKKENPLTRTVYVLYPYSREFSDVMRACPEFRNYDVVSGESKTEVEIKTFFVRLSDDNFADALADRLNS